jgi:3-deoxy-D-manno-octulosonate 8-phosphate phosphatase (KDO 8-P phosphatase)
MAGLRKRARSIRLAIFDVDGVLTDGTVWMGPSGEAIKAFNILDGHGIKMIQQAGVATAILSGRKSRAVALRAKELGIGDVIQGSTDKLADFAGLAAKHGVTPEECAFVGDDLPDLPVMERVGLAVAVANAVEAVKKRAHYITRASGGHGAVREFCDMLVAARGKDGE